MSKAILKYSELVKLKVCRSHLDLFKELFGNQVEVTVDLCVNSCDTFPMDSVALYLLDTKYLVQYVADVKLQYRSYVDLIRSSTASMDTDALMALGRFEKAMESKRRRERDLCDTVIGEVQDAVRRHNDLTAYAARRLEHYKAVAFAQLYIEQKTNK